MRGFLVAGAVSGAVAMGLGALAAHPLRERVSPELLATFETGVRYQMYHALALIGAAWAMGRWPGSAIVLAGWCFVVGTVLFSGSLYLLVLTGARWLGAVTPLGGLAFIGGWVLLAWGAWTARG